MVQKMQWAQQKGSMSQRLSSRLRTLPPASWVMSRQQTMMKELKVKHHSSHETLALSWQLGLLGAPCVVLRAARSKRWELFGLAHQRQC